MAGHVRTVHELKPNFVHRDDILLQLDKALLPSPQSKLVTSPRSCNLYGCGGVGKTQLALQFAFSRERHYNAIFWVQADKSVKLADSFDRIARSLRIQDPSVTTDQEINRNLVLEWLSDPAKYAIANGPESASSSTKWLVIFDDVGNENLIQDYWPSGGCGSILFTSRQPMARPTSSLRVDLHICPPEYPATFLQTLALNVTGPTVKLSQKLHEGSSCTFDNVRLIRNDLESKALVRALNMVACAFRPLNVKELIEALTTSFPNMIDRQDWESDASWFGTSEDLKTLSIGFLEVRDSGMVEFSHGSMRTSILSHNYAPIHERHGVDGHEMLATVCIQHLRCLDPCAILKSWTPSNCGLAGVKSECALQSYTITFWQEHSRIADVYSKEIPAMLHKTFVSVLVPNAVGELTTQEQIDMGLWLCTVYGFKVLCRTYLEMGADPNAWTVCHKTPIHSAAEHAGAEIIMLLLERGGDVALPNEQGFTPLHVACASGNAEATDCLIRYGADINCQTSPSATAYAGAFTPLYLAVLHGRHEIVQTLLSQPKVNVMDLESEILSCALEIGYQEILDIILDRVDPLSIAGLGFDRPLEAGTVVERLLEMDREYDMWSSICFFSEALTWLCPKPTGKVAAESQKAPVPPKEPEGGFIMHRFGKYNISADSTRTRKGERVCGGGKLTYPVKSGLREARKNMKLPTISRNGGSRAQLDKRYSTKSTDQDFFIRGRVFALLWHQSYGDSENSKSGARDSSRIRTGGCGQENFSHIIQHMVVVKEDRGYFLCMPLTHCNASATWAPDLSKRDTNLREQNDWQHDVYGKCYSHAAIDGGSKRREAIANRLVKELVKRARRDFFWARLLYRAHTGMAKSAQEKYPYKVPRKPRTLHGLYLIHDTLANILRAQLDIRHRGRLDSAFYLLIYDTGRDQRLSKA